jgi:hypothetical protein
MLRKEASEVGGWERRLIKSKTGRDRAGKGDYIVGVGYGNEVLMVNEIKSRMVCIVCFHCGGRPTEVNACVLNSYMV